MGFSTDAVHAGEQNEKETGAVTTPIHLTSTYAYSAFGEHKGYEYGRGDNYTRSVLEAKLAVLERGACASVFPSGMAAVYALISLLEPGSHIIATENVYGGTYRLFEQILKPMGFSFSWVDTSNISHIVRATQPKTKMIFIETPSNPLLRLTDLHKAALFGKENGFLTVVDNTFVSPYFQKPLTLGIDVSLHSTTKYIGGHADILGGALIVNDRTLDQKIKWHRNATGASPSAFDCWLLIRSLKTLPIRMERHQQNASAIARKFAMHNKVKAIHYPGLFNHPHHDLVLQQMTGAGGIVTLDLETESAAKRFLNNLKIFTLAESLGGVESLVCHPATMSHAAIPKDVREKIGITDGLVRLSAGIEDLEDLINDIERALVI